MRIRIPEGDGTVAEIDTAIRGLNTMERVYYRCPACGAMVDATNAEEILIHHEHVASSQPFGVLSKPAV